ncbi:putative 50S ribosomal protein L18, cyanelle-like [Capsicum annuum]|nr:putative 50S ribosomal protein L18, cyanelle-like [Capsicum annuum]
MILLQVSAAWTFINHQNYIVPNTNEEEYDAVVICNGHFTEPRIADILGGATSANDISREIAEVAKGVHISSRSALSESTPKKLHGYENLWLHSMIEVVGTDDGVRFQDGSKVYADIILHCTGYKYHFPFLETNGIVTVDENRVGPLYKDIFPPAFALSLSFVGLLWKGVIDPSLPVALPSPLTTSNQATASLSKFYQKVILDTIFSVHLNGDCSVALEAYKEITLD